jgi:aryl-alcohol dehydrogenase-like predicted oxidoreductase
MIERAPFGRTGHESTRVIFGAAALASMGAERAEGVLELLLAHGVNHLDTAAGYGDSELRLAPWLRRHPGRFFLATKTGERTAAGARASLGRSLERLGVERVDLLQLHNLVDEEGFATAFGPGGAVEALAEARAQGQVRFLGVTGHGSQAAAMHLRSLERFEFDSVLLPYNFTMMQIPAYAADFERLAALCAERGVAVQTIKSVARRRWPDASQRQPDANVRRFSWYEPLSDPGAVRRAVHFVLARPGLFLDSSSDARLLPLVLEAASESPRAPEPAELRADVARFEMRPLFVPGVSDSI